jgi:hypothetical protein
MKLKEPIATLKPSEQKMEDKPSKKKKIIKRGLKMKLN